MKLDHTWILERPTAKNYNLFKNIVAICLLVKVYRGIPFSHSKSPLEAGLIFAACLSGIGILLNWRPRTLSLLSGAAIVSLYGLSISDSTFARWHSHHVQLLAVCLLGFGLQTPPQSATSSSVGIPSFRVLQVLTVVVYACAVINKLNLDFISGIRLQQLFVFEYHSPQLFLWSWPTNLDSSPLNACAFCFQFFLLVARSY